MWLSCKPGRDYWAYGIARFEDGTLRIVKELFNQGFASVGKCCGISREGLIWEREVPRRLMKDERRMIIQDLYLACCEELGIKPELKKIND